MYEPAREPNDLERLFVEHANAGDVDSLVALYEPGATVAFADGQVLFGHEQIRQFFADYLKSTPRFAASDQSPALCCGDVALTSSRHRNGDVSAEVARRQADGTWLWVVDHFALASQDGG